MESVITWALGGTSPDTETNLARIAQWWSDLAGQEIIWKQRPIPASGNPQDISWDQQKFDETFAIQTPQLRGITLYWRKPTAEEERNITVSKLELDLFNQQLDIFPASGNNYQIRLTLPKIVYQAIELNNPQFGCVTAPNGNAVVLFRDDSQRLDVKINLDAANLTLLQQKLAQNS
ncbi:hypothetical protein TUMEXPCC7403_12075 [Tumidithrix helvetica PCC 7403]|uniref:hypothetical protein n=1 Tax=Tumidithrix helvetica TaxID=3457545 RepID=UPI003C8F0EF0